MGRALPEEAVQYGEFAVTDGYTPESEKYWLSVFSEEIPELNKNLKSNRNFRFLVLAMVLIISGFLPQVFNIIAVCFSVLLNKLSIYINLLIEKKGGK
jgi:hypothetical protein